ncbi:MAG TPA: hypothetical protein VJ867_08255 [Gemmatimonadaceae bacterium]|nr:hypothetical protein [Gemmatimonadaceae bacterium]
MLIAAAVVATAASRAAGSSANVPLTPGVSAFGDLPQYIRRPALDSMVRDLPLNLDRDPLAAAQASVPAPAVAQAANTPTVSPAERKLTAVLISDDGRVAVIDDSAVAVGDVLRDGSRVSAIQANGVWLVDRNGRWRMLALTRAGGR